MEFPAELAKPARVTAEIDSHKIDLDEMRAQIVALEGELFELKNRIGEYYWQMYSQSGYYDPNLRALITEIQARADAITATELEIQIIEDGVNQPIQPPVALQFDRVVCHSCGAVNEGSARFCASCGMKLKEDFTSEYKVEDYGICPLCGAALSEDAIFCYTCGARIKI